MTLDWRLTLFFLVANIPLGFAMRAGSVLSSRARMPGAGAFVLKSPLLSIESLKSVRPARRGDFRALALRTLAAGAVFTLAYLSFWRVVDAFHPSRAFVPYLALPVFLSLGETLSGFNQLLNLPSGNLIPAYLQAPLRSKTLSEFWGKRWNTWFNDWFRQVVFARLKGRPLVALFATFFVSGLIHDAIIALPLKLFGGADVLGRMTLYFMIQPIGMVLDRSFIPPQRTSVRRLFFYAWAIVPAPLFLNEAALRTIHAWPF